MGTGGMRSESWEGKGTGGTGSGLLGVVHCRGISAASVLYLDFRNYCSDLVGTSTGGRDGLHVHALERNSIVFLDLADVGTGGTKLVLLDGVHGASAPSVQC